MRDRGYVNGIDEKEVLARLRHHFAHAAEACDLLAVLPARGRAYDLMRRHLRHAEERCRQMAHQRGDARWLRIGLQMEEAHQRAGDWLRRTAPRPLFLKLAENLRAAEHAAVDLETRATGRIGPILPKPQPFMRTQGRPVQVMTAGGVLLP